jgi:hypothetical protein
MFQRKSILGGVTLVSVILAPAGALCQDKPKPAADLAKTIVIEKPAETIVARASGTIPAAGNFVNPKVQAGLVKWHASLAVACEASAKSSKPVLLFQMMGKLDDRFC